MRIITLLALIFVISAPLAWGQATSNISGTVQDSSGLAVPAAEIKATQTETGFVRNAVSGPDGNYLLTNLPIGPYRIEVSKQGFSTYVQSGVVLQVDTNPSITIALKVGNVTEQVQVEAAAAVVETQSTAVGNVVDNQRVVELPLNGRNTQELLLLAAPSISTGSTAQPGKQYPTSAISVAGSPVLSTLYQLDGVDHSSVESYAPLPLPFPDALQEFKLETSSTPARYGHHAGGVANILTKSGTNEIHGDLFEFFRNGDLNARNFFAAARDTLKRNQFGGVIGGAAIKNKLFYFGGYQDTVLRSDPATNVTTIPTPQMLAGDFTTYESPACQAGGRQGTLTGPFVGNKLTPAQLNPITQTIASWLPKTPVPNGCGIITYGFATKSDERQIIARADFQKSEKHTMFARFYTSRYNVEGPVQDATTNLLAAGLNSAVEQHNMADTGLIGDTYLISPTIVSTFRAVAEYNPNNGIAAPTRYPRDIGIDSNSLAPKAFTAFNITGSLNVGTPGSALNQKTPEQIGQITEDIDMTKGNHQIAFGGNFLHARYAYTSLRLDNGEFTFTGGRAGNGLADFVAGLPTAFNQGYGSQTYEQGNVVGLYVQDSWKATRRLTLNYGVRWEPFLPYNALEGHPFVESFNRSNFLNNVQSQVYVNAPAGLIFPGDKGWNTNLAVAPRDWHNFGPRVGVVLDPRGRGREVIRAGYGIFYDYPGFGFQTGASNNPPYGNAASVTNPDMAHPWANYPGGDPFPYTLNKNLAFPLSGLFNLIEQNSPTVYVQQWNFSVQRQMGSDWSLTAAYVGNKATHQWIDNEMNPAIYIPGNNCVINGTFYSTCSTAANTEARRILALTNPTAGKYYSTMQAAFAAGNSSYHGLSTTVQKRFGKGVSALLLYTWAHCISTAEPGAVLNHYDSQDPFNFQSSRGDCGQDVRHLFSASFVFLSPKFSNTWVRRIASNWQLSPIIRANSALPVNPLSGKDNALNGTLGNAAPTGIQRPNYICDPNSGFTQSLNQWYNTACIVQNGVGQLGNAGRNSLRGVSAFVVNVALTRRFAITEKQGLEVRAESFNLPNLVNFAAPGVNLNASTFGKITSTAVSGGATSGQ